MSDLPVLPEGWKWATVDELALSVRNGVFVSRPGRHPPGTRILRISAVRPNALDRDDVRYVDPEPARAKDFVIQEGDLLFTRYSGNPVYVGACVAVGTLAERTLHPDKLIRVVVDEGAAAPLFVQYAVNGGFSRLEIEKRLKTTAGQVGIAGSQLRAVPIPLAPLSEQRRIIAAIEEHLSHLDAAEAAARSAYRRIKALERSIITQASSTLDPPQHWRMETVGGAGTVGLGLQRSPKRHKGPRMRRYLRVANVFEDRIDDRDVMSMDMTDAEWERFRLRDGDVLLNEGQSPELLGRPAMYRGDPPDVAFTNSLIRFQANNDVDPEWALLVFRSHMHTRRFMRESQITTNIAHLAAGRFKTVEFPIPPHDEQRARVTAARVQLEACARFRSEVVDANNRAAGLRRSILAAAFSGQLVPQDPGDEPASVLLERIRNQRAATTPTRRTRTKAASR